LNMSDLGGFQRGRVARRKIPRRSIQTLVPNMGLLETRAVDTLFEHGRKSFLISSSMGNTFGIFEALDFVVAAFLLGFHGTPCLGRFALHR